MNENIFRTGPPACSLRAAERVDGPGVPGSSPGGGDLQAASGGGRAPIEEIVAALDAAYPAVGFEVQVLGAEGPRAPVQSSIRLGVLMCFDSARIWFLERGMINGGRSIMCIRD